MLVNRYTCFYSALTLLRCAYLWWVQIKTFLDSVLIPNEGDWMPKLTLIFFLFLHADNDMQGTDGPLGGPDVRRRIPIKLLPKQARNKPAPRPQRPAGRLLPKAHSEEGIVCLYIFNDSLFYILSSILPDIMMHFKWSLFLLGGFNFKQEDRFDCGVKAGDAFASQRRFPQQLYWDYKVLLYKL